MTEELRYPELPPGYVWDKSYIEERVYVRAKIGKEHDPLALRVIIPTGRLSMGDVQQDWTYNQSYPTVQDAIDADVARLWMGAWE